MNPLRLAIDGGTPALPEGPPSWPLADERVRAALEAAYLDGGWGKYHGGRVEALEAALATMHAVEHVLTCSSGTIAVEIALRSVKVSASDEVILAGYDFSGNFRAVEAIGARPVLADIDPQTWCIDASQLAEAISPNTKAVVVSHLHGGLADMRAIGEICHAHGIAVVEDACQTPGGLVQGKPAGTWGDVGVLSFGGSKLLTCGRGGAVLTNDPHIAQRAKVVCDRGNHAFPLSELQAAALLPQLATLAAQNRLRQQNVATLLTQTGDITSLQPVSNPQGRGQASYYKLAWLYRNLDNQSRAWLIRAAQAEGLALDAGFRGFATRSVSRCRKVGEIPHSRAAAEQTVVLHHPVLLQASETLGRVALALRKICGQETTEAADPP